MSETIETYRGVAHPWHCDSMGHVTTRFYTAWFDDASYHLFEAVEGGLTRLKDKKLGWADAKCVLEYKHEMLSGDLFVIRSSFTHLGGKSLRSFHEMLRADGVLLATQEMTTVQFNLEKRAAAEIEDTVRSAVAQYLMSRDE